MLPATCDETLCLPDLQAVVTQLSPINWVNSSTETHSAAKGVKTMLPSNDQM